ncbi:PilI type IV pilus biogenesis protein, partial [Escherichia coli]|nr:PilI type IV pilus biogenesis protein [Escherichia coli]
MPQQHPGRLQILVVDAHCKRRLFSTKTPTDPDELARRFCTPDNCCHERCNSDPHPTPEIRSR